MLAPVQPHLLPTLDDTHCLNSNNSTKNKEGYDKKKYKQIIQQ